MYKGIIFDLDGTLLDTIVDLSNSVNEVLKKHNYPTHSHEAYKSFIGNGMRKLLERSLPENGYNKIDEMQSEFLAQYDVQYMRNTKAYEGIGDLLDELQRLGIKFAVNSNKKDKYTKALIKEKFPNHFFVDVIGEQEGRPRKPDPQAALYIAQQMKLKPGEVLYIGDSKTDILTGENAKMDTGAVAWGFDGREAMKHAGATHFFEKPYDILDIIIH